MVQSKLIIGASGLLGSNLKLDCPTLRPNSNELDITNRYKIESFFNKNDFDEVILLAAYTNVGKANKEKEKAYNINVSGVRNLLPFLGKKKITYISTDYVFDGTQGMYKTTDPVNPVPNNYYALTKAIGEELVRTVSNHLIIRTSFCRSDIWPYPLAIKDQFTSRDKINIIAPKIVKAIQANYLDTIHIGTERKSVLTLAQTINPYVQSISRLDIANVGLPYDTSLVLSSI